MDSIHRHELQQNDLRKLTTRAVPFVEKYGWQLLGAVAAVVVAYLIGIYWFSQKTASSTESWTEFDRVLHQPNASAGDYASLAEKFPGTAAAGWSRLKEADDFLKSGLQAAFTNRDVSQSDLKSAKEAFQKLAAGGPGITPDIRERALFGLARTTECLSDGNEQDAIAAYASVLKEFPNSIFKTIINERIKALESPDAKSFYAWFHEQKPQPKDPHNFPFKSRTGLPAGDLKSEADESMDEPDAEKDADTPAEKSEKPKPDDAAENKPDSEAKPDTEAKPDSDTEAKPDSDTEAKPDAEPKPSDEPAKPESK